MKFIAMKFQEKQAECFLKREINWHVSSVVVRQEESLEVTSYVHLLNKQDWFSSAVSPRKCHHKVTKFRHKKGLSKIG